MTVQQHSLQSRREWLEQVDYLLGFGFTPQQVADDLGIQVGSVARRLERYGHRDLARPFYRQAMLMRRAR